MQNENRPSWDEHDTAASLEEFIRGENEELQGAIELCELGADPFEVIGEIGDIFYLWAKRKQLKEPVPVDIVDILTNAMQLCSELDLTPDECARFKYFRNIYKYPYEIASNGYSEKESIRLSKALYSSLIGGDKGFYHTYMMMADEL